MTLENDKISTGTEAAPSTQRGTALFEVHGTDGRVWKVFGNGEIEGFHEGCQVINRIPAMMNVAYGNGYDAGMKWNTE